MPKPYSKKYLEIRTLKHLSHRLGSPLEELQQVASEAESLYRFEKEPKKNGGFREISKPHPRLKKIQKGIHRLLTEVEISECAHGGIKGRSNLANAKEHCNQRWVLNLDFKSFFPSISHHQVYTLFFRELKCSQEVSSLLTRLCTVRGQVPQGGSMSMDIANLGCRKIDKRIEGLTFQYGIKYTRFVDDITLSGNIIPKQFIMMVKHIIKQSGFTLTPNKEKLRGQHQSQIVTGLSVNRKNPKVPRKIKREWGTDKYVFEKYGFDNMPKPLKVEKEQQIKGRESYLDFISTIKQISS